MSARITNNPKEIRLEVRLSSSNNEKLKFCQETLGCSKGEIIRLGIEKMYNYATFEKLRIEALAERQAEEERVNKLYERTFIKAFAEEYFKSVTDPDINLGDMKDSAKVAADKAIEKFKKECLRSKNE